MSFGDLVGLRGIPRHYGDHEFDQDAAYARSEQHLAHLQVRNELERLSHVDAVREIQLASAQGWIKTQAVRDDAVVRLLEATLDRREPEAIALALDISADLVLVDERDGRSADERAGLRGSGALAALLRRKGDGHIGAEKPEVDRPRRPVNPPGRWTP